MKTLAPSFLLLVSLLQPLESFSVVTQCNIKEFPVCIDSTPCKTFADPSKPASSGATIEVCLSTAAKAGAMTTTASCWNYSSTYDCINPHNSSAFSDTCAAIKSDTASCPGYQEIGSTCAQPTADGCLSFDVTYRCEASTGQKYQAQDCGGVRLCISGACAQANAEKNNALAKVAAAHEVTRQAGVYANKSDGNPASTDPNSIKLFEGEAGHCSQNTLGLSNCCVPNPSGGNWRNQLIAQQLLMLGWNAWVKDVVGSSYTYDTLFSQGSRLLEKGVKATQDTINRWTSNGAPSPSAPATTTTTTSSNTVGTPTAVSGPGFWTGATYSVGGFVGGTVGNMAGSKLSQQWSANTQWSGVIAAVGTTTGTVAGTALAGAIATTGTVNGAMATINPYALGAILAVQIVMSMLACDPSEAIVQMRLGANLCHWVGSYCQTKDLISGNCMTREQDYCCFNSILNKIIQEQGRTQIGKGWGVAGSSTDCSGLSITELNSVDFSKLDLTEFTKEIVAKSIPNQNDLASQIQNRVKSFFNNNATNPTATGGIVVHQMAPQPAVTVSVAPAPQSTVTMSACNVSVAKNPPATNGDITANYTVTNCNSNSTLMWMYVGTCSAIPTYTSLNQIPVSNQVLTDQSGSASYTVTVPVTCLGAGTPSTYNAWKFLVNDPVAGAIGAVNAPF